MRNMRILRLNEAVVRESCQIFRLVNSKLKLISIKNLQQVPLRTFRSRSIVNKKLKVLEAPAFSPVCAINLTRKDLSKSVYPRPISISVLKLQVRTMASADVIKAKLDKVRDVDIDSSGRFKYVLIKLYVTGDPASSPSKENFKYVVRGYADCPYHGDVYDRFVDTLKNIERGGYDTECVGGGRITHDSKKIVVFGYSQGFGKADHSITVEVLKKHFSSDYSITWSDDGY